MSFHHLFSRLRLASILPAERRHPSAPLARSVPQLHGPFLHTTLPNWAAETLEREDLPREAASFVANRRDTGATYLVHGLQCGTLQVRVVIPVTCPGAAQLFAHLTEQERVSLICDIDESSQSIELAMALDKQAAIRALAAPSVPTSDQMLQDEAEMLFCLVHAQSMPSLISGQHVQDVVVLFCGDLSSLSVGGSPLSDWGREGSGVQVH